MKYLYPNLPNWIDPAVLHEYDPKMDWIAEKKKNGWRCLAMMTETGLELWTRRKTMIHDALPKIRTQLSKLPPLTIIDGELLDKRTKDIKDHYYAFDIIMLKGDLLTRLTWKERRKVFEDTIKEIDVDISEPISIGKSFLYKQAVENGDEGIVMKNIHSKYLVDFKSCPKNPLWIKAKRPEDAFMLTSPTIGGK